MCLQNLAKYSLLCIIRQERTRRVLFLFNRQNLKCMDKIILKSKERDIVGKGVKKYRKEGLIPGVIYGHKTKPQNLWVDYLEFKKVFSDAGENTVIELDMESGEKNNVIIYDVQSDPVSDKLSHIDFFKIRMDEKIETEIPLEFIGESPAVKELGGILVKNMDEIPVSCFPADLPHQIEADVSALKTFEDHLKVADLKIPEKVEVLVEKDSVIALVEPPRSDEELAKLEEKVEEDVTKVEGVVKEEKKEDEEERGEGEVKLEEKPKK